LRKLVQQYLQMLVGHVSEWDREGAEKKNETQSFTRSTVTSKRADGNPNTMAFVGSPELVTAMAIAGDLGFNL
jgi:aconitate hydratase